MLEILPLKDRPEFADTCAAWSFGEWGCLIDGGRTLDQAVKGYRDSAFSDELPQRWICLDKGKIAGTVSLKMNDHPDRTDLNPWLASLFVHPRYRKKGIATALCRKAEQEARDVLNIRTLYLFTPDAEKLYAGMGWRKLGMVRDPMGLQPEGEVLMQKDL